MNKKYYYWIGGAIAVIGLVALSASKAKASNMEPSPSPTGPQEYIVQAGDSLSKIALRFYGSVSEWGKIFEANKSLITNPTLIYPGQKLIIP